jgi:ABC-type transport system involved in multi-copper enzyme maturation permease subunit
MTSVLVLARNTYREIIRDRILYGLMVFAVMLIALSIALGQLSFAEQARITVDFGFTAIHLSAVILSIFVGSTLVGREIEKKTILTLLVRPISRTQFIVGKSFGLMGVILMSMLILTVVLAGILLTLDLAPNMAFAVGLFGVVLEAAVLLCVTLFFGSFSSPILSVSFTLGVFLIGHWLDSLRYFAEKSGNQAFVFSARIIRAVLPNLEYFNWRSLFVYGDAVSYNDVVWVTVYCLAWAALLISISAIILGKRDLG